MLSRSSTRQEEVMEHGPIFCSVYWKELTGFTIDDTRAWGPPYAKHVPGTQHDGPGESACYLGVGGLDSASRQPKHRTDDCLGEQKQTITRPIVCSSRWRRHSSPVGQRVRCACRELPPGFFGEIQYGLCYTVQDQPGVDLREHHGIWTNGSVLESRRIRCDGRSVGFPLGEMTSLVLMPG